MQMTFDRYTFVHAGLIVLGLSVVICFNVMIDPLWAYGGNKVTGVNVVFDERLTKIHQLRALHDKPTCFILGSSRAALIDARMFRGEKAFNMAFSAGRISDFIAYANYIKAKGYSPSKLIVEASRFNFSGKLKKEVPTWVNECRNPPWKWFHYISLDVVNWSLRTLRKEFPRRAGRRYYDKDLVCQPLPGLPAYEPEPLPHELDPQKYDATRVKLYRELKAIFPNSRLIIFMPPVSPWRLYEEYYGNKKPFYDISRQLCEIADAFYDFSVPSELTYNRANTYDGVHFYPRAWSSIIDELDQHPKIRDGHRVTPDSFKTYKEHTEMQLRSFERTFLHQATHRESVEKEE